MNSLKKRFFIWSVIPALLCVMALWYPFGFSLGAMLEEWGFYNYFNHAPSYWNSFPGNPLSDMSAARPLQLTPFLLAKHLTPHSFTGIHLFLMLASATKIIAVNSIGYFLFRDRKYALAFGLLFMLFPADTQQMSLRTMNHSVAAAMMLGGVALALRAIVAPSGSKRLFAALFSIPLCCIAPLLYEAFFVFYLGPPLFLIARYGLRRTWSLLWLRRKLIGLWLLAPAINIAYLYYALVIFKTPYQNQLSNGSISKSIVGNLPYLWNSAAYRIFLEAWTSSFNILAKQLAQYGYLAGLAVLLLLLLIWLGNKAPENLGAKRAWRMLAVGMVLTIAGYLPFMVSSSHVLLTQRAFMPSAFGASLVGVALAVMLSRFSRPLGIFLLFSLTFLGLTAQLYQFDFYNRYYATVVRPYTNRLADEAAPDKKVHLVFDESGYGGHYNGAFYATVSDAPNVRRGTTHQLFVLCKQAPLSKAMVYANCELSDGVWTVSDGISKSRKYPADIVDVIRIGKEFDSSYLSKRGNWQDSTRYTPSTSMFKPDAIASDHYDCQADSMWGYAGFCRGEGWSEGIFGHSALFHQNWFSAITPAPSLLFQIKPSAPEYQLQIEAPETMDPNAYAAMGLQMNGAALSYRIVDERYIEAAIPASMLKDGLNEIRFSNALQEGKDYGFSISRITLAPAASAAMPARTLRVEPPLIAANRWIDFNAAIRPMLDYGFSGDEPGGIWTDGRYARIRFKLPANVSAGIFKAELVPYFDAVHTHVRISVEVNGSKGPSTEFRAPAKPETLSIPFQIDANRGSGKVELALEFDETGKPGKGDQRNLALFFKRFMIEQPAL